VPFFVRAGKALETTRTEVIVELRKSPQVVFVEPPPKHGNYVRFLLSPEVEIAIGARAKRSGEEMIGAPVELSVVEDVKGQADAYERLLSDAMMGDPTLFATEHVVEASWAIVEPVLHSDLPVYEYARGSAGPSEADRLVKGIGGWTPTPE
jgi:glucose-6-phosphate 1-dehydrogenase